VRPGELRELQRIARRHGRAADADDLLQEALIEAVRHGRLDFTDPDNRSWLMGVLRNKAKMAARGGARSRQRDGRWLAERSPDETPGVTDVADLLDGLPPSLKSVAALALAGQTRREIAYLLGLNDTALRQRLSALRRALAERGAVMPAGLPGLGGTLDYGRIRDALVPMLHRQGGMIAAHDPDGHLFVIRGSQKDNPRQ
jgi:RNA polymerase sigma-70 factor (ECF subfamily)